MSSLINYFTGELTLFISLVTLMKVIKVIIREIINQSCVHSALVKGGWAERLRKIAQTLKKSHPQGPNPSLEN